MKIVVDALKCRGCGECIKVCPEKALSLVDQLAVLDESQCDFDGICIPACPCAAISYSEEGSAHG
jgi:ferredoxin